MNQQQRSWETSKAKASKELSRAKYYKEYQEQRELWDYQWNTNISRSDLCLSKMQIKDDRWLSQVNDTWTSRFK